MKKASQPRRGFTLVELLVVIGIIAVLISLLLPALATVREQGKLTRCLSNMRQFGIGINLYAQSYKGHMPIGKSNFFKTDWPTLVDMVLSQGKSGVWTDNSAIFLCPTALHSGGRNHYSAHPRLLPQIESLVPSGGVYNLGDPYFSKKQPMRTRKLGTFKNASDMALIWDGNQSFASYADSGNASNADYVAPNIEGKRFNTYGNGLVMKSTDDPTAPALVGTNVDVNKKAEPGYAEIRYRHSRGKVSSFLFADGHAAPVRVGELLKKNILMTEP